MALERLPVAPAPDPQGRSARRSLPAEPGSVPRARRFVREALDAWDLGEYEESGMLLVSELVGNAVLHARTELEVWVGEAEQGVLLAVTDASPVLPVLRRHSREAATGRGLWLLDQYSAAHGVARTPGGKQVWAVLCPEVEDPAGGSDAALAAWLDEIEGL